MLQMGTELTADQRLSKCTVDILGNPRYIAFNGVLMIGERATHDTKCGPVRTAATNGRDEYYHPEFVIRLTDAELRYVILHEGKHKMYRHLITWRGLWEIDPECANKACDYVINLEIEDENKDGFAMRPREEVIKVCVDERFRGMNSKQIFDILRQEKQQGGGGNEDKPGQPGGDDEGAGFDVHDWEGADDLTDDEKHQLERDIDEAIRQGALAAGKAGTSDTIDISELLTPQLDWRQILREFIQQTCAGKDYSTYNRPNRRYRSAGIYMPTGVSEQVGELICAQDMSGSTGMGKMRPVFQTEIQNACDTVHPEALRMLYWDTEIAGEEVYQGEEVKDFHKSTKPKGGGGTVVSCVSQHLIRKNIKGQAIIILTDGEIYGGDWGTWTIPVLWVIVDNPRAKPPCGKVIHVDSAYA
jgi:predicted metal-dependent peptidase